MSILIAGKNLDENSTLLEIKESMDTLNQIELTALDDFIESQSSEDINFRLESRNQLQECMKKINTDRVKLFSLIQDKCFEDFELVENAEERRVLTRVLAMTIWVFVGFLLLKMFFLWER